MGGLNHSQQDKQHPPRLGHSSPAIRYTQVLYTFYDGVSEDRL